VAYAGTVETLIGLPSSPWCIDLLSLAALGKRQKCELIFVEMLGYGAKEPIAKRGLTAVGYEVLPDARR